MAKIQLTTRSLRLINPSGRKCVNIRHTGSLGTDFVSLVIVLVYKIGCVSKKLTPLQKT